MLDLNSYFRYISSSSNDLIKDIKQHLEGGVKANRLRKDSGLSCIEGIHLLRAWVDSKRIEELTCVITSTTDINNSEIIAILTDLIQHCEKNNFSYPDLIIVDDSLAKNLSSLTNGPFIVGQVQIPSEVFSIKDNDNLVILDSIQDSGNVGTILRTALAAGYRKIICTQGTANIWSVKVLRAAMGAHTHLNFIESINPQDLLNDMKQSIYVTALDHEAVSLYKLGEALTQAHAFVFGNEGKGVNDIFINSGIKVFIPQDDGVESLNVSAAAAICLFEARRINSFKTQ